MTLFLIRATVLLLVVLLVLIITLPMKKQLRDLNTELRDRRD